MGACIHIVGLALVAIGAVDPPPPNQAHVGVDGDAKGQLPIAAVVKRFKRESVVKRWSPLRWMAMLRAGFSYAVNSSIKIRCHQYVGGLSIYLSQNLRRSPICLSLNAALVWMGPQTKPGSTSFTRLSRYWGPMPGWAHSALSRVQTACLWQAEIIVLG